MALQTCEECEGTVSSQARCCPHCGVEFAGHRSFGPRVWVAGAAIVAVTLLLAGMGSRILESAPATAHRGANADRASNAGPASAPRLAPGRPAALVTAAAFQQIQSGMRYEQVRAIIGAPGEEMSRMELAGTTTVMYSWANTDGSNMNAMFQNGALISKAQFGLK